MEQQQPTVMPKMSKEIRDYLDTTYREYFNLRSYRAGAIDLWEKLAPEIEAMIKERDLYRNALQDICHKEEYGYFPTIHILAEIAKTALDQYPSPKDK